MKPYFTIITIHLNNYEGLLETLESIKSQSFKDYEVVIKDGISAKYLKEIRSLSRSCVKVVISKDEGIYDAMNQGVAYSTGKYLLFINSGDILYGSRALEIVYEKMSSSDNYQLGFFSVLISSPYNYIRKPKDIKKVYYTMPTIHQGMVFSAILLRLYPYSTKYKIAGDFELIYRILSTQDLSVAYGTEIVSEFRADGISCNNPFKVFNEVNKILKDHNLGKIKYIKSYTRRLISALLMAGSKVLLSRRLKS